MRFTRRALERLYFFVLLVYSVVMFIMIIFEAGAEFPLAFPLYFLLSGYAFMEVAFPKVTKVEKILASLGFSMAFLVGLNAIIQTFGVSQLFSELTFVTIIAVAFLIARLAKMLD